MKSGTTSTEKSKKDVLIPPSVNFHASLVIMMLRHDYLTFTYLSSSSTKNNETFNQFIHSRKKCWQWHFCKGVIFFFTQVIKI